MTEIWKPVLDSPNHYEVSNLGRLRNKKTGRIRKLSDKYGYQRVCLQIHRDEQYKGQAHFSMHKLVWEAFNGRVPEGLVVRHLNDVPNDNRLENLDIGTDLDNLRDAQRNGIKNIASTPELAQRAVELRNEGKTSGEIEKELNLSRQTVSNILYQGAWGVEKPTFTGRDAQRKITDEEVKEVFQLRNKGLLHREIGKELGISRQHVGDILNGRRRKF